MKLRYEQNGEQIAEFTELTYFPDEKKFVLKSHESESMEYCSLLDLDDEYNPDDFSIEFLNNPKSTENSIFTVEVKTENKWKRIGWIFPIQDMNSILGEKRRVKKLFNDYTKESDGTSRNELNEECKKFLHHVGRKIESDVTGNIYAVRCLLVHKMYSISAISSKDKDDIGIMINNINTSLTAVIQDMLISFRK